MLLSSIIYKYVDAPDKGHTKPQALPNNSHEFKPPKRRSCQYEQYISVPIGVQPNLHRSISFIRVNSPIRLIYHLPHTRALFREIYVLSLRILRQENSITEHIQFACATTISQYVTINVLKMHILQLIWKNYYNLCIVLLKIVSFETRSNNKLMPF